jgi:hypothetical protein
MGSDELLALYTECRTEVFTRFPERRWSEEADAFNDDCNKHVYSFVRARAQQIEDAIVDVVKHTHLFGTPSIEKVRDKTNTWCVVATGTEFVMHQYGLESLGKVWYSFQVHEITYFGSLGFKPTVDEIMTVYGIMGHTIDDTLIQTKSGWLLDQERHLRSDSTFAEIVTKLGK